MSGALSDLTLLALYLVGAKLLLDDRVENKTVLWIGAFVAFLACAGATMLERRLRERAGTVGGTGWLVVVLRIASATRWILSLPLMFVGVVLFFVPALALWIIVAGAIAAALFALARISGAIGLIIGEGLQFGVLLLAVVASCYLTAVLMVRIPAWFRECAKAPESPS